MCSYVVIDFLILDGSGQNIDLELKGVNLTRDHRRCASRAAAAHRDRFD